MSERRAGRRPGAIVLASYGFEPGHMSLEAVVALKECDEVYSQAVDAAVRASIARLGIRIRRLPARREGGQASFLLGRARRGGRVAYLAYGNPLFLDETGQRLKAACEQEGLPLKVCHSVSSLDLLLGSLPSADLADDGLYLCAPSSAASLDATVPALVFLLGSDPRRRFAVDCISRKYPSSHVVELLRHSAGDRPGVSRRPLRVGELRRLGAREVGDATLYIPPLSHA